MPSRGVAPVLGSFRVVTLPSRVGSHNFRAQSSRLLSTAALKHHPQGTIRPQFIAQRAYVQQRSISWSPNTWFGGSSQPAQTAAQTPSPSQPLPESATAAISTPSAASTSSLPSSTSPSSPVPTSPTSTAASQEAAAPIDPTVTTTDISDINLDPVQNVGDPYLAAIPERIGYLKELGIDYGWGPTSILQWTVEHVHIYSGLPWWGSIVTSAILLRLMLFPLFLRSSDVQAKMQALKPVTQPAAERMKTASQSGDQMAMQKASEELKAIYRRAEISIPAMFVPIVIQGSLAYCALKLMRAMANLPVPGFQDGGILWFTDLTFTDPYLILPALMGTSMHLSIRFGGEAGLAMMNGSPGMKTILLYIMPVAIFISMTWFPAAVNVWLASTGSFAILQARLLQNNSIREVFGLTPLVKIESAEPIESNTIKVNATSRPSDSSSGVQYQAPNIKFSRDSVDVDAPVSIAEAPPLAVRDRFRGFLVGQANALGRSWEDILERGRGLRMQYFGGGGENKKKGSTMKSKEFLDRAKAYERRTQMKKGKYHD